MPAVTDTALVVISGCYRVLRHPRHELTLAVARPVLLEEHVHVRRTTCRELVWLITTVKVAFSGETKVIKPV